jgi:RHS repeat-associated protein
MFQAKERNGDLDYYGARYYDSRQFTAGSSMRWISADSLTSRIYDPPSLNKYTFVRNDPVNYVDPDGRDYTIAITVVGQAWRDPSGALAPGQFDIGAIIGQLFGTGSEGMLMPPARGVGIDLGDVTGDPDPLQSLESLLANKALLESGLRTRAGIEEKKGKCYDFLLKVIAQLNSGRTPALAANFTVEKLVSNVMAADKIPTTVADLGANARTVGNTINIAGDPVESMGNDYFSTFLHEGFHLLMSGRDGQILDQRLKDATSFADGTRFQGGSPSEFNKQMFGQNCGPGM